MHILIVGVHVDYFTNNIKRLCASESLTYFRCADFSWLKLKLKPCLLARANRKAQQFRLLRYSHSREPCPGGEGKNGLATDQLHLRLPHMHREGDNGQLSQCKWLQSFSVWRSQWHHAHQFRTVKQKHDKGEQNHPFTSFSVLPLQPSFQPRIHQFVFGSGFQLLQFLAICPCFVTILTWAPDRAHLWDLPQSPAASSLTAALHLSVLTALLSSTTAIRQSGETSTHTLIWRRKNEKQWPRR